MARRPLVIGIAGGSGSGKTSLAEGLVDWLGDKTKVFHLDDYFIARDDMPILAGKPNWDDPRSLRYKDLVMDVEYFLKQNKQTRVLILEGFLILHFPAIRKLLDVSIFLNGPHEVINKRRVHEAGEHYREKIIKPMYKKYVVPSAKYADCVIDVSNEPHEEVLARVKSLLESQLSQ